MPSYEETLNAMRPEAEAKIAAAAERLPIDFASNFGGRFELLGFRPLTAHPEDWYLWAVMARRSDGSFATWTYNATDHGFASGHYDLTLERALLRFTERTHTLRAAAARKTEEGS